MTSDQETRLLERAAAGESEAFRVLFESHRDGVFRLTYRLTGAQDVAEDVTQECFLSLIRNADRFDSSRASLRQYLYGMARNLTRQHWQTLGREMPLDDEMDEERGQGLDARTVAIETGEVAAAVQAAIGTLPVLQREALVLFEFEELSLEEIAGASGCDAGTVKSRLHRARARLRRLLGPCWNQLRRGEESRLPSSNAPRGDARPASPKRSLP